MSEAREWILRIHSNNDDGGYLYSGSDVKYPKDDYLKVVEKSAYDILKKQLEVAVKTLKNISTIDPNFNKSDKTACLLSIDIWNKLTKEALKEIEEISK